MTFTWCPFHVLPWIHHWPCTKSAAVPWECGSKKKRVQHKILKEPLNLGSIILIKTGYYAKVQLKVHIIKFWRGVFSRPKTDLQHGATLWINSCCYCKSIHTKYREMTHKIQGVHQLGTFFLSTSLQLWVGLNSLPLLLFYNKDRRSRPFRACRVSLEVQSIGQTPAHGWWRKQVRERNTVVKNHVRKKKTW